MEKKDAKYYRDKIIDVINKTDNIYILKLVYDTIVNITKTTSSEK